MKFKFQISVFYLLLQTSESTSKNHRIPKFILFSFANDAKNGDLSNHTPPFNTKNK